MYSFNTEKINYEVVEIKGEKKFYITGHISTGDRDLLDDIVTDNAQQSMLRQLKSKVIKLDYEHESFRDDPTILPVGKIVEANIDTKGLWVKCELNDGSPKFKALWKSVKKGFVDAFSIAFRPIKTTMKSVGDTTVRLLEDLELLNVALTGVPVNPAARINTVMMKALMDMDEENKMEEKIKQFEADLKSRDEKIDAFEKQVEELKSQAEKIESVEAENTELKSKVEESEKSVEELKSKTEELSAKEDEVAELKSEVEKLKKEPVMKSMPKETPNAPAKAELKSIIGSL